MLVISRSVHFLVFFGFRFLLLLPFFLRLYNTDLIGRQEVKSKHVGRRQSLNTNGKMMHHLLVIWPDQARPPDLAGTARTRRNPPTRNLNVISGCLGKTVRWQDGWKRREELRVHGGELIAPIRKRHGRKWGGFSGSKTAEKGPRAWEPTRLDVIVSLALLATLGRTNGGNVDVSRRDAGSLFDETCRIGPEPPSEARKGTGEKDDGGRISRAN